MKINTLITIAPLLRCLLCEHDNLSLESISMDHYKKPGTMAYTCNHSTGEGKTSSPLTSLNLRIKQETLS